MAGTAIVDFRSMLSGEGAFYKQPDYIKKTVQELSRYKALAASYIVEFESKIVRVAKFIFSLIIFPIFIHKLLHKILGVFVYPATLTATGQKISKAVDKDLLGPWKYKRFSIEVDGNLVDATLIGKESTLDNGKFVLRTVGNSQTYDPYDKNFKQFLDGIEGNAILMEIPGVAASEGLDRYAKSKAYNAMLQFMEDQKGLGANQIIGHGFSIGAVVQAEGLELFESEPNLIKETTGSLVPKLFIKDRTLASLAKLGGPILGLIAKIFDWNQGTLESSRNLKAKEIIIQTARVTHDQVITDGSLILNDGVINAEPSLAKCLLNDNVNYPDKVFIGTNKRHNEGPIDPDFLASIVNQMMPLRI